MLALALPGRPAGVTMRGFELRGMMRKIVAGFLALLVLGGLAAGPAAAQVLRVGSVMPNLIAHDQNGAPVSLQVAPEFVEV